MLESDNDGFYWEPDHDAPLRQGDLLYNVPTGLMPDAPRFVLGEGTEAETVSYDDFPELAPSTDIVVEARFGALAMVITPTCHFSEGEKDEDIVSVVPVEPLGALVQDRDAVRNIARGKNVPLHCFGLPVTRLGGGILPFHAVALLDRPSSTLKHDLLRYRRLGLHVDARVRLRAALAGFWGRVNALDRIEESIARQLEAGRQLEDLE